jgi:hypothetical protein
VEIIRLKTAKALGVESTMPRLIVNELLQRDAKRSLADELAAWLKDLKAGKVGRITILNHQDQVIKSIGVKVHIRNPTTR